MRYFVSGHLNLSQAEFETHYIPAIEKALSEDVDATFVVGDAPGTDSMTVMWLLKRVPASRVTVFHLFVVPRLILPEGTPTCGKFMRDADRDAAMTRATDVDIAWVRPEEETRALLGSAYRPGRVSGTQKNLERRKRD